MKHFATALLGFGIMLAALPAARAADTICNGPINNTTINGNLVVPQGGRCFLGDSTVTGNVRVQTNADLQIIGGSNTIDGNVDVGKGATLLQGGDLTVVGNIEANQCQDTNFSDGDGGVIIVGGNVHIQSCNSFELVKNSPVKNEIGGNFICINSNFCVLENTNVNNNVQFINNSTAGAGGNTIGGNLICQGNGTIQGGGNTVDGHKTGQCAGF